MDIVQRFIAYTKFNTTANAKNKELPSSKGQMELANFVAKELKELGLEVEVKKNAITKATLKGNCKNAAHIAFFAHLDTSDENCADTKAQILHYKDGDLCINEEKNIFITLKDSPSLAKYQNEDIITTNGESLLGADDKAAIASIVSCFEYFIKNPEILRGDISLCLLPDEEIGLLGAKALLEGEIKADFGYCLDCCGVGELIYENWNAGSASITFNGISAHPINAKNRMLNSLSLAHKFISMLPSGEVPEYSEKKEGYIWLKELNGTTSKTTLQLDIREFDELKYKQRFEFLQNLVDFFKKTYGEDKIQSSFNHIYENAFNHIKDENHLAIKLAKQAYEDLGIKINILPMRGGYDGAVISAKNIPCPNLFTGAYNFHSIYEFLPVSSLKKSSQVLIQIVKFAAKDKYKN